MYYYIYIYTNKYLYLYIYIYIHHPNLITVSPDSIPYILTYVVKSALAFNLTRSETKSTPNWQLGTTGSNRSIWRDSTARDQWFASSFWSCHIISSRKQASILKGNNHHVPVVRIWWFVDSLRTWTSLDGMTSTSATLTTCMATECSRNKH